MKEEKKEEKYLSKIATKGFFVKGFFVKDFFVDELTDREFKFFSRYFVEFFKGYPWNEWVMCPKCKSFNDFGPAYTWGEDISFKKCPYCGTRLVLFWSPERTELYFKKNESTVRIVYYGKKIAAWAWGYVFWERGFYLDTVGVVPQFRERPGVMFFVKILAKYFEDLKERGVSVFLTRTHKKARTVRYLLEILGFKEGGEDPLDPNRTFWFKIEEKGERTP